MGEYDDYRLNLLATAIQQLNERAGFVIDKDLEKKLSENFQYDLDNSQCDIEE